MASDSTRDHRWSYQGTRPKASGRAGSVKKAIPSMAAADVLATLAGHRVVLPDRHRPNALLAWGLKMATADYQRQRSPFKSASLGWLFANTRSEASK